MRKACQGEFRWRSSKYQSDESLLCIHLKIPQLHRGMTSANHDRDVVALGEMEHQTAKLFAQVSFWPSRNELYSIPGQDDAATARLMHRRRIDDTLRMPTTQPTKAALELVLELAPQSRALSKGMPRCNCNLIVVLSWMPAFAGMSAPGSGCDLGGGSPPSG